MADLRLERRFDVAPERLFAAISRPEELVAWWGPEGMSVPEHDLDFTRKGPGYSVMVSPEGQRYKVSGQLTHYDPPKSLGFTFGWHDDADARGAESHVTLRVEPDGSGARLILEHLDLPDQEQAANHESGWTSSLRKLEAVLAG